MNQQSDLIIIAILTLHPGAGDAFREYETRAAKILMRYGGAIERTVVVEPAAPQDPVREVHILRFPSLNAFTRYRTDAELAVLANLRAASIADTEVLLGREGPDYMALTC